MRWAVFASAIVLASGAGHASAEAEPVFVPGLYETESRDSPSQKTGVRDMTCLAFADADAFQRETIARYATLPQFKQACTLSAPKPLPDGFAFAMDCGGARSINAFHFAKDLVTSTTETHNLRRPENSATSVTLSRRIGDCQAEPGTRR